MLLRFIQILLVIIIILQMAFFSVEGRITILPSEGNIPILSPIFAERKTEKIRLSNGLEAYLISDPQALEAGAALSVHAGSWDDPKEFPGLAHFVEHMLFLGTDKYPKDSEYDRFIQMNDGQMNAYTSTDYTLYLFSVKSSAFEEGLNRFSSFFKTPLLDPMVMEREIHAIDQEFEKNVIQNGARKLHIQKELANPKHPFHHFSTGNLHSLSQANEKDLRQWFEEHYNANLMKLIVYGPQTISQLKKWVSGDFKDIPSHTVVSNHFPSSVLNQETAGKMVYVPSAQNNQSVELTWELSPLLFSSESLSVLDSISAVLRDERPGSLLATLKREGLATDIHSIPDRLSQDSLLFSLHVNLTKKGLDQLDKVIEYCFQWIHTLQQTPLPPYLFDDLRATALLKYQYQSRESVFDYLMNLGGLFAYEKISSFPENGIIPRVFSPETFADILKEFTPKKTHFTLITKESPVPFDHTEQWMNIPYAIAPISQQQLTSWDEAPPIASFSFPPPNPFIPKHISSINEQKKDFSSIPTPILLVDNRQAKIYFAKDNQFYLPQTAWFFEIKTPSIGEDPVQVVLADLYLRSIEEAMRNFCYHMKEAGLSYQLTRTPHGISLSLFGFSDTVESLFTLILQQLQIHQPSEEIFEKAKKALFSVYGSIGNGDPLQRGFETYHTILHDSLPTPPQLLTTLEKTSYSQFLPFIEHLYDATFIEGFFFGNISQQKAITLSDNLLKVVGSKNPYPQEQWPKEKSVFLPVRDAPLAIEMQVGLPANAAVLAVQEPHFSFKNRAAEEILSQAMSSAFYSTLRTKQQTGYLTKSMGMEIENNYFTFFSVQSATHDPRDLLARFELFIETFLKEMPQEVTEENFLQIRNNLLQNLEDSAQNMAEMGYLLQNLAFKYHGDFEWLAKRKEGFKTLTYEEFLATAKNFLGKQNKQRMAVLLRGNSKKDFHYQLISANPHDVRKAFQ